MRRFGILMALAICMAGTAQGADGVREALGDAIPLSSMDSIESLTRYSATRLGVETVNKKTLEQSSAWAELTPEEMQAVLEAASDEGLPVTVENAEALAPPPFATVAKAPAPSAKKTKVQTAAQPTSKKKAHGKKPDSDQNRPAYLGYQTLLSTYVYGLSIPLAYGAKDWRVLTGVPLITAPLAFGAHLLLSRDMEFTESHLKGTIYFPTLSVYAATALPLAFSDDFGNGYRVGSLLGAVAYPLGVWYGYHLGDQYRNDPDQLAAKYYFALGYAFLGLVTPTLYFEHPDKKSDEIWRIGLGQSVGMAALGHVVADFYRTGPEVASGVSLGILTHTVLGGLGGIEASMIMDASSVRTRVGPLVLGATLGFTEGVLFFHSSDDNLNRARYSLIGGLGGAMVGTGLQLLFYDGTASARSQRVSWSSAVIGGAWLGYGIVYLLTSEMTEAPRSKPRRSGLSTPPSPWAFNPVPVLEPVLSRGDVATRWKVPGFSRHF